MKVNFRLPVKPFSINQMSGRDQRFKTSAYRDWASQVFHTLSYEHNQEKLSKLRECFDPKLHAYRIRLVALYPEEQLFNKQGIISSRTIDISNYEKPLVDLIFLPKFHTQEYPNGAPNLNVDDKQIDYMISRKAISPDENLYIDVTIWIKKRKTKIKP